MINLKNALSLVSIEYNRVNALLQQYNANPQAEVSNILTKLENGALDVLHLNAAQSLLKAVETMVNQINSVVTPVETTAATVTAVPVVATAPTAT